MRHELKTWPAEFQAVLDGRKRHEVRRNDRNFQEGDEVLLREWKPGDEAWVLPELRGYTGMQKTFVIGHVTAGPSWGLPEYLVVFTLIERDEAADIASRERRVSPTSSSPGWDDPAGWNRAQSTAEALGIGPTIQEGERPFKLLSNVFYSSLEELTASEVWDVPLADIEERHAPSRRLFGDRLREWIEDDCPNELSFIPMLRTLADAIDADRDALVSYFRGRDSYDAAAYEKRQVDLRQRIEAAVERLAFPVQGVVGETPTRELVDAADLRAALAEIFGPAAPEESEGVRLAKAVSSFLSLCQTGFEGPRKAPDAFWSAMDNLRARLLGAREDFGLLPDDGAAARQTREVHADRVQEMDERGDR